MRDTLLAQAAAGAPDAVQALMDRYGPLVWSLARRFCYDQSDLDDAVQEIFIDVWRSAARYDPAVAGEATFVAMIARRRLIDRQRRTARRGRAAELPANTVAPGPPAGGLLEIQEDAGAAAKALGALSAEQQRVLRLSIYHGLSHERISEATGLPLGTVKTHVRRGLIRMRALLDDPSPGPSVVAAPP